MAHTHPVVDSDSHFIINSTTRVISTTSDKLELIQGDHQSERITFEIPKIVEGHDMSLCDRIEVHYINIDRRTSATSRDVYIADDVAVDGDKLTFSWLISGNATKYYGRLNFIILFECLDPDGNYTYKWNTEICKLLTIGEGISNTSAVIEDHSDILEKFRKEILEEADEKNIQPDWNQNNETAPDYVKNRPFYTAIDETVLVEERTVPFADSGQGFYAGQFLLAIEATVGEIYKVYWDGTVYECTCVDFNGNNIIGNLSIAGFDSDTGEPFVMQVANGKGIMIITADTSASHTFSISRFAQEVVKIDEKYLPSNLATKSEVESTQKVLDGVFNSVATFTFDKQTSGRDMFVFNAFHFYKISDFNPAPEDVISFKGTIETGNEYSEINIGNNCVEYGGIFIVVASAGDCSLHPLGTTTTKRFIAPSAGLYAMYEIDDPYQTARTGEFTLRVSTGSLYITGLLLKSSTVGSTKKFKITVDDSGAIRATEVI